MGAFCVQRILKSTKFRLCGGCQKAGPYCFARASVGDRKHMVFLVVYAVPLNAFLEAH